MKILGNDTKIKVNKLLEESNAKEFALETALKHYFGQRRHRFSNVGGQGTNKNRSDNNLDTHHQDYKHGKINPKDKVELTYSEHSKETSRYFKAILNRFKELFGSELEDAKNIDLVVSIINFICDKESSDFYGNRAYSNQAAYDESQDLVDKVQEVLAKIEQELLDKIKANSKEASNTDLNESFEIHKELNPNLFENNKLKSEVREKLIEIADEFINQLEEDEIPIKVYDYWLVGSNASYNYNNKSDIDLHIIVDIENTENPKLIEIIYNLLKSKFNDRYDISIKGQEVELYLEDINSTVMSNGIYSIKKDEWVKEPKQIDVEPIDVEDTDEYDNLFIEYQNLDDSDIETFIDNLYILRKESLAKDGEYGLGNLIFKEFRNNGYIDSLKDRLVEIRSKELTLEQLNESVSETKDKQWVINQFKEAIKQTLPFPEIAQSMINAQMSTRTDKEWEEVTSFINKLSFPQTVYRGLRLGKNEDINLSDTIGESWTVDYIYDKKDSKFNDCNVILKGTITEEQIDYPNTIHNYILYSAQSKRTDVYPEFEITLKKNTAPRNIKIIKDTRK